MVATPRASIDAGRGVPDRLTVKQCWKGIYAMPADPLKTDQAPVYRCIVSPDHPVPVQSLPSSVVGAPELRAPVDALYCSAKAFPDEEFLGEREKLSFEPIPDRLVSASPPEENEENGESEKSKSNSTKNANIVALSDATTSKSSKEHSSEIESPKASDSSVANIKTSSSDVRSLPSGASWQSHANGEVGRSTSSRRESPFGDYKWITFKQTQEKVEALAWALQNEIQVPTVTFDDEGDAKAMQGGDLKKESYRFVGIWARSSAAWRVTDFACNATKLVSVPLYDTLGQEALLYILNRTQLQVLFVEGSKLYRALQLVVEDKISLRVVICFDPVTPDEVSDFAAAKVKLYDFDQLLEKGKDKKFEKPQLDPEDICTVIFTSGTTGVPKGVVHTNGAFVASIAGYSECNNRMNLSRQDSTLSYLPQSHIYQRGVEIILTYIGVKIGYYSGEITRLVEDIQHLRPTVFFGVPRVYTRMLDRIMLGVKEKSHLSQWMFRKALAWKESSYKKDGRSVTSSIPDFVFSKIRSTFGGRLKTLCMGSAPMKPEAIITLQLLLASPVCEGWGMTETGICFLQEASDSTKGTLGGPLPHCEGELWVRGPSIMKRYFRNREATEAALDKDGWLRTGDVVELLLPSGAPRIIDRAKNIFKLAQGEYIAPERLENIFVASPYVEQIYLHGDSVQNCLVAVVVPPKEPVLEWAKKHGKEEVPYCDLLKDVALRRTVLNSIAEVSRGRVYRFEEPKNVFLTPHPFTTDNGLATPTMKVIRKQAKKEFRKEIDQLYEELKGEQ
ncbi:amp-binding enzyme domain-containing protein [Cystoisospora suis]|uniref:Amp-binding enzyme domain-containing protein n=1 Tax=Cystoisospora suis TaxID=483139 RepID=A0A2C6KZW5_9APIC|nr:amp-binding enzyme domain-containing protein [Cystoisospora suis]